MKHLLKALTNIYIPFQLPHTKKKKKKNYKAFKWNTFWKPNQHLLSRSKNEMKDKKN